MISTNDKNIRAALGKVLEKDLKKYRAEGHNAEIFEELGGWKRGLETKLPPQ